MVVHHKPDNALIAAQFASRPFAPLALQGCSSFDGALMEVGPFRMDPHNPGSLVLLEQGGWEEFSGIVFGASLALVVASSIGSRGLIVTLICLPPSRSTARHWTFVRAN